jgi:hypothetical protein
LTNRSRSRYFKGKFNRFIVKRVYLAAAYHNTDDFALFRSLRKNRIDYILSDNGLVHQQILGNSLP